MIYIKSEHGVDTFRSIKEAEKCLNELILELGCDVYGIEVTNGTDAYDMNIRLTKRRKT